MKKLNYLLMTMMAVSIMVFSSCDTEDPVPAPTVQILTASVDGYVVAFTIAATDGETYSWNFGDDAGTSTEMNPTYTYPQSGAFTATVTVTNASGTADATKDVTIAASSYEMLTGGPALAGGKSWVMSSTDAVFVMYAEDPTLADPEFVDSENPAGVLGFIGLASEYEDTFTFLDDGTFTQDPVNSGGVASALWAAIQEVPFIPSAEESLGLAEFTAPTGATFTYNESDLTMTIMPDQSDPSTVTDVTYTGLPYIEVTGGGYLGIIEWPRKYPVLELTTDKLVIGIFAHFPDSDLIGTYANFEPTHALTLAFVPATK